MIANHHVRFSDSLFRIIIIGFVYAFDGLKMELLPFVKGQLNGFDFINILYDRKATFKCLIGLYIIANDQNVFFDFSNRQIDKYFTINERFHHFTRIQHVYMKKIK